MSGSNSITIFHLDWERAQNHPLLMTMMLGRFDAFPADEVREMIGAGLYRLAAHVAADDEQDVEWAFQRTNSIDRPWVENEDVTVFTDQPRSTSVGDIAIAGGVLHLFCAMGPMQGPSSLMAGLVATAATNMN